MIVGNIVNCETEVDEKYFNCITIDFFTSEEYKNFKYNHLPTLVIGWGTVKGHFNDVSILSKTITPPNKNMGGVYWTFSKTEKRGIFEENLKEFKEKCYIDLIKHLKTYNIDPILYKIKTTDELSLKLTNLIGGIGYLYQERVVYIYKDDVIYMLDLELLDFIGFNRKTIIDDLNKHLSNFGDNYEEDYTEELKHLSIKYTPYFKYKDAI